MSVDSAYTQHIALYKEHQRPILRNGVFANHI
jgi:hypothetical protein